MSPQQKFPVSFAKRVLLLILFAAASIFLIKAIYALGPVQSESSDQQRKLKVREFKDLPVALVEVRNLQSETWYEDLEIELKNVSNKPIYFLTAYLEFPDEQLSSGSSGVHLSWGNPKKLDDRRFADSDAEHVDPSENFVVTIPKMYMKGLRAKQRLRPQVTKNLRLWFEKTYFGDGTGFESEGRWRDFRGNGPPPPSRTKDIIQRALKKSGLIQSPPPQNHFADKCRYVRGWNRRRYQVFFGVNSQSAGA